MELNMEKWTKWIPVDGIPSTFYNESVLDDKSGLTLTFKDDIKDQIVLIVKFEGLVLSYRNTDEGSLGKMLHDLQNQYDTTEWSLFNLENSEYIQWFLSQSGKIYSEKEINHYVFLTSDDVIEVLSTYKPSVQLKNNLSST